MESILTMMVKRRDLLMALAGASLAAPLMWLGRNNGLPPAQTDVRLFGAAGDGVQDDTRALQAAIDSRAAVLLFPPGIYRITQPLKPQSLQTWAGSGNENTIIRFGGDPTQSPFNLLHDIDTAITDLTLQDITFYGGQETQLTHQADGQAGFALYLRCSLHNLTIRRCRFENFGDGRDGGGGIILGPLPDRQIASPSHITIEDCHFRHNGNVPGLYICSGALPSPTAGAINIRKNRFEGTLGSSRLQNAIYVLGSAQAPLRQAVISDNLFSFSSPVDVGIELNWTHDFVISANTLRFTYSVPMSSGMLIRDGCQNGTITGNTLTSTVSEPTLRGISLVNFAPPQEIRDVVITGNVLHGIAEAIAADRGSVGILIASNRITGPATDRCFGIRVADCRDTQIRDNLITDVAQGILLAVGDRPESRLHAIFLERNRFLRCGSATQAVIAPASLLPENRISAVFISGNSLHDSAAALVDTHLQNFQTP